MTEFDFKRLLTPTRVPESAFFRSDYTLNLYRGCNHGCIYCDTRSACYHIEDFDTIRVKRDCLAALETELKGKKQAGVVSMGAASDAYYAREAALHFWPWYSNAPRTSATASASTSALGCASTKSLPPVSPTMRG